MLIHFNQSNLILMNLEPAPMGCRVKNITRGLWYDPATKKLADPGVIPPGFVRLEPEAGTLPDAQGKPMTPYSHLLSAEVPTPADIWGASPIVLVVFHRLAWPTASGQADAPGNSGFVGTDLGDVGSYVAQITPKIVPLVLLGGMNVLGMGT